MVQLQQNLKKINNAGIEVVFLSYDSPATLKAAKQKQNVDFTLLSDPDSKTIDAYDVRNPNTTKGTKTYGIPYPTTFVVDKKGKIKAILPGTTRTRHSVDELIKATQ